MPHGGPIDIRDSRRFDPLVQYFASWGFGILQATYRGSSEYGRRFTQAGRREWAAGIEDDREGLLSISPAYHLADISTPILVVYGDSDRRVDPDHAHRLIALLELYRKQHEEIRVENGAHSFGRDQWIGALPPIRRFLEKHLMPGVEFLDDPK